MRRLSARVARIETAGAGLMAAATLGITGAGAITRALGAPLLWADEAAIAAMTWGAFLGASALFASRGHMAIELLPGWLGAVGRRRLALMADVITLAAFFGLGWLLWRWFDLPGLLRTGSAEALSRETFNFIWLEPTQTLGIRKVWIWLILPIFTLGGALHTLSRLVERTE